jgi:molybdenum cofactor synthesis domain-containing protein
MSERAPRTAAIVIIGDEILSGEVADENAAYVARTLTGLGIRVASMQVVPDKTPAIAQAIREAGHVADLVIVSGGIGPTHDDVTRQAVAEALELPCERHAEAEDHLRRGYGSHLTGADLEMADLPRGARLLTGSRTGAYGFAVAGVHVLPGVPILLREIFAELAAVWEPHDYYREEIVTSLREGHLAPGLRAIQAAHPRVAIGSYPVKTEAGYRVRIVLRAHERVALDQARDEVLALLEDARGGPRS